MGFGSFRIRLANLISSQWRAPLPRAGEGLG